MMKTIACHAFILLAATGLVSAVSLYDYNKEIEYGPLLEEEIPKLLTYVADEEKYYRHIHSMMNAYRGDLGGQFVIETNALVDTKYKTWKRNADMINSLLALPKGMNDAGR